MRLPQVEVSRGVSPDFEGCHDLANCCLPCTASSSLFCFLPKGYPPIP